MTTHTLSLGPLSLLATQTGPLLTITIHTPSDTAPVGRMTLTVAEWTSLVALVDCMGAADGRIADLTKERDALIASMYSAPFDRSLVVEVCHDLINRAMRNESDEIPDWRSSKHDRDKEAAIRALIADRDSLRQQVRELTEERDAYRHAARLAEESTRLYDLLGEELEQIVGGDGTSLERLRRLESERDRLRSDLSAALVSVDAMAEWIGQMMPVYEAAVKWRERSYPNARSWIVQPRDAALVSAIDTALAHTAREQGKEKDNG